MTSISVIDGLGSLSSFWYSPSTMRSETTWRKVFTSSKVSGLTISVEPLERMSSTVFFGVVSTRKPSWKIRAVRSGSFLPCLS